MKNVTLTKLPLYVDLIFIHLFTKWLLGNDFNGSDVSVITHVSCISGRGNSVFKDAEAGKGLFYLGSTVEEGKKMQ